MLCSKSEIKQRQRTLFCGTTKSVTSILKYLRRDIGKKTDIFGPKKKEKHASLHRRSRSKASIKFLFFDMGFGLLLLLLLLGVGVLKFGNLAVLAVTSIVDCYSY